jgi:hypothetical protein
MAIKSVISAGTKSNQFEGPIVKIGASNSIKLTRQVLDLTGAEFGHFAFIADDTDDNNLFYIATSESSTNEAGERGSKLGIVGEVTESAKNNPNQLAFTHATLGVRLYDVASTFRVDTDGGFEHNGLTFYPMSVEVSREEWNNERAANEAAKASKADSSSSSDSSDESTTTRSTRRSAVTAE